MKQTTIPLQTTALQYLLAMSEEFRAEKRVETRRCAGGWRTSFWQSRERATAKLNLAEEEEEEVVAPEVRAATPATLSKGRVALAIDIAIPARVRRNWNWNCENGRRWSSAVAMARGV